MKKLFNCEIHYFQSPHLSQIYDGFEKLRKQGIIDVTYKNVNVHERDPRLTVILDNQYTIIYDLLDGLNWSDGTLTEKLEFFKNNTKAHYYFKRSFPKELVYYNPSGCKVFPLGLNYPINAEGKFKLIKELVFNSVVFKKLKPFHKRYPSELFESKPVYNKPNNILFYASLWNPDGVDSDFSKQEREIINEQRIHVIRTCRKEFGKIFEGGIVKTKFSESRCKDIVAPETSTQKLNYLKKVKSSNICISTTGLHGSIGWQMGEYIAASKAIVSMPLNYELPGSFLENKNYLSFRNDNELITNIYSLLNSKEAQINMMNHNFEYYNAYVRPDMLILNSLLQIYEDIN